MIYTTLLNKQSMDDNRRIIWMNGRFLNETEALLPAESRGVMYGAGCFETLCASKGQFLHLERHLARFNRALDYFNISGEKRLNVTGYRELLERLLSENNLTDEIAVIRHQGVLGGGRGYGRENDGEWTQFISADRCRPLPGTCRLITSRVRAVPGACRPADLKLSNAIHYMAAWREAREAGGDDALLLTSDGVVAESAVANIFWKSGDVVYTPAVSCDILPGIMRDIIMRIISLKEMARVVEGRFDPGDLVSAESVWISNSLKGVQAVSSIDGWEYDASDTFLNELKHHLNDYKRINLV